MAIKISSLSKEFVKVSVRVVKNGVDIDPTADTVEMAFTTGSEPQSGDWKAATWETAEGPVYFARCLVGPGGTIQLTDGSYKVWVKVADSPEVPVRDVGKLVVT